VLFTPLAPYETPEALDRICEEYNRVIGNFEVEPLIAISIFIHDFLCIHPFNDDHVIIRTKLEKPSKIKGCH
jgi:Fic family protein